MAGPGSRRGLVVRLMTFSFGASGRRFFACRVRNKPLFVGASLLANGISRMRQCFGSLSPTLSRKRERGLPGARWAWRHPVEADSSAKIPTPMPL